MTSTAHAGTRALRQNEATAAMLQRRNASKLNDLVQALFEAWAEDGGIDTDVDLLIDRLHEDF